MEARPWPSRFFSDHRPHSLRRPRQRRPARLSLVRRRSRRARQAMATTCASRSATGTPSAGRASTCSAARRFDRPVVRRRRPDGAGRDARPTPRSSSSRKLGRAVLHLPRSRRRARRRDRSRRRNAAARPHRRSLAAHMAAHRRAAAVGHGQSVQPSPLRGRRGDQSRSGSVRLCRRAGEEGDGGHAPARRRELRAVGRARGLRHAAQHRPAPRARSSSAASCSWSSSTSTRSAFPARCSSSPSRWSRPSTSTTTTPPRCTASCSSSASSGEIKLNIEANHATLAGHSFQHELAYAFANDLFGSVDANRGDPQNGWDTDQFPNSADETTLALYTILQGGGFTTGGFNFDAKLRRQSVEPDDLLHAHIGGMDTLARGLLRAARMIERGDARPLRRRALRRLGRRPRPRHPRRQTLARRARAARAHAAASSRSRAQGARRCWRTWSIATRSSHR